jgi:hypothetical protein
MRNLDRIPKAVFAVLAVLSFVFSLVKHAELSDQQRELIQLAKSLNSGCH